MYLARAINLIKKAERLRIKMEKYPAITSKNEGAYKRMQSEFSNLVTIAALCLRLKGRVK